MAYPLRLITLAFVLIVCNSGAGFAQYFGQNKVQYRSFDFQILKTEHFDLYYYAEEEEMAREAARMAERWYARLSKLLDHQLSGRQPLILYASHPHFEQTNVIEGQLGEGTGGVTEALKRRIVMPAGAGLAETDHVLGHELVHAFQYDILGSNLNLPLWFIEGMAEYLSVGSVDPHTAVWLRDAALNEKLPDFGDLNDPRYFPYRFGQAMWAYIGGRFGDETVANILHEAAGPRTGGRNGGAPGGDPVGVIEAVTGVDDEQLAAEWHESILTTLLRPLSDRTTDAGRRIIEPDDDNELNVGPVLSPDGTRLAFLSSRDRLSIDLFVADAATGKVLRKLVSTAADPHFDSLQFISSAGSFDPTGSQIAVAAIRAGRPVLAIIDVNNGRRLREIALPGVDEVFHPAWSPNGNQIAFAGLSGGLSDLWLCDVRAGTVRKLTDDSFTDLHPAWAPDGGRLVFSTDRFSTNLDRLEFGDYELATIDVATGKPVRLFAFEGSKHISPQWARDGSIYFIANPDGVPDVYQHVLSTGTTSRITRLLTGASGITAESPALALAANGSRLAVVVYKNSTYEIHSVEGSRLTSGTEAPSRTTMTAAQLPPATRRGAVVDRSLQLPSAGLPTAQPEAPVDYKPRLKLDYIGQEYGITTTNSMGAYMGGGIAAIFSDMLGNHQVSTLAQVNGNFEDFGGQIGYLNRTRRWNWGAFVEQLPYVTGGVAAGVATIDGNRVIVEQMVRDRQVDRRVLGLVSYPFSRARRFEVGASMRFLTFDRRLDTRIYSFNTGELLSEERERTELGEPLSLSEVSAAFVQDTALFGATGPILGHRSRFEVAPAFGDLRFTQVIADARHYVMPFTPLTIAGRFLHVGRYGSDAESFRLSPLFVGFPNLVRGYDAGSFDIDECLVDGDIGLTGCAPVDQLIGSRLMIAGVELRAPLVGMFTGELEYGPIPAEVIAFFDAGVAWDNATRPQGFGNGNRPWARSFGAGLRVNALGYLILEIDAVRAIDRPNDKWRFVFGVRPGF
jgi:Tol biopolymer transport system component